jgi:hypothetical protein
LIQSIMVSATKTPTLVWSQGSVVLANRQILTGEIVVQPGYDLVLFRNENGLKVYPAHLINAASFYDAEVNTNKYYVSQVDITKEIKIHSLYEVWIQGEIKVLRKQKTSWIPSAEAFGYNYFILTDHGMVEIGEFKKKIYPQMIEICGPQLIAYKKQERLSPNYDADAVVLIEFYNRIYPALSETNETVSGYGTQGEVTGKL